MKKPKNSYHHGNLAESLLNAVDEIATKFGSEAVSLRACAKLVGVSPSSAFRHYADKRDLMTAFATRALHQMADAMQTAGGKADKDNADPFSGVALAYIKFALDKPAFFRAMWSEETVYTEDENYVEATTRLGSFLSGGFADTIRDNDPANLSAEELLAWSSVHGLANLFVDGPVGAGLSKSAKLKLAADMIDVLRSAVAT